MANLKYIGKNILNHDLILKKGDVSGSSTSTGSFGRLEMAGGTFLSGSHMTLAGNVSSSLVSTGSFGTMQIA